MSNKIDSLLTSIHEIIGDYRSHDPKPGRGLHFADSVCPEISEDHIRKWINQFDEQDQEFILSELLHLLPQSYLTKDEAFRILDNGLGKLANDLGYSNVIDFLKDVGLIHCQGLSKSQTILIDHLVEYVRETYGFEFDQSNYKDAKIWLYIDDVLASGRTYRRDMIDVIDGFGSSSFQNSDKIIISIFFVMHEWRYNNTKFSLRQALGFELIEKRWKFYTVNTVDNNPRLQSFYNPSPSFNHLYPLECELGENVLNYIKDNLTQDYPFSKREFAFRPKDHPKKEKFFSTPEARIRYENILLKKGFEIMNSIENHGTTSIRPLGFTTPTYLTLGTGTHFFTWRNVSNTCPLVFWWESNGWTPLLPRKH